jgi:enoyl-CoA hydratase/carnithine racemase
VGFQCLTYEKKDEICYLTLNRPEKLNALNATMLAEFREAMDVIEVDPEIRVVILTGAGRALSPLDLTSSERQRTRTPTGCSPTSGGPI